MSEAVPYFEATCVACSWSQLCGPEGITRLMMAARRLKRSSDLSLAMLSELFQASAGRLVCPECGHVGLVLKGRSDLDREGWPGGRPCTACGKTIPDERLAIFPNASLCAACQDRIDRGEPVGDEYCPRCGYRMQLRANGSQGLARYDMVCTNDPPLPAAWPRLTGPDITGAGSRFSTETGSDKTETGSRFSASASVVLLIGAETPVRVYCLDRYPKSAAVR